VEFVDGGLRVRRETDAGIETVRVTLPAVVTTDLRLNEPRYASLPSIMKARAKQIDLIGWRELGVTMEPRVHILSVEAATHSRRCILVRDVEELIERLRCEAKVI
jgi:electron transfer flavoprotein beta subunit